MNTQSTTTTANDTTLATLTGNENAMTTTTIHACSPSIANDVTTSDATPTPRKETAMPPTTPLIHAVHMPTPKENPMSTEITTAIDATTPRYAAARRAHSTRRQP